MVRGRWGRRATAPWRSRYGGRRQTRAAAAELADGCANGRGRARGRRDDPPPTRRPPRRRSPRPPPRRPRRPRPPPARSARPARARRRLDRSDRVGARTAARPCSIQRAARTPAGTSRPVGRQQQRDLGELRVAGRRPARRRAWRRSRPAWRRSRDRSGLGQAVALQAFRSFSIVRYSRVPAFDSLTPEHAGQLGVGHPGVELQGDDLPLARGQLRERGLDRGAAQRDLGVVAGVLLGDVLGVGHERRDPSAPAKLVERRVASDTEQPRPLLTAASIERPPAPVGALERERGDVLGGGRIAQQRRHVRVHVVAARAVQRLEPLPRAVPGSRRRRRQGLAHTLTTRRRRIHHSRYAHAAAPEQPRVVRDHPGDAERVERPHPRQLVDRPHVHLAAGAAGRRARAGASRGASAPSARRTGAPGSPRAARHGQHEPERLQRHERRQPRRARAERIARQLRHRPSEPDRGSAARSSSRLSRYWVEISARSSTPWSRSASSTRSS